MMVHEDVLWTHAKVTNPNPVDIKGYWWTCVAMPVTDKDRVITPADLSVTPCTPWPYGAHTLDNTSFRGPDIDSCSAALGGGGDCAWQQDMSFLGNIPAPHDFFVRIKKPQLPYIAHTRDDGYTVIHSHPLNGTKFFTWGMSGFGMFQQDFMSGSDYQHPNCSQEYYDPFCEHYKHEGRYTELQIGPAPTQMHTFPIANNSEYQWTEWFKGWKANSSRMHATDYRVPLREVSDWLESPQGMSGQTIADMDAFLEKHSSIPPTLDQVVSRGMPWGGLYEQAFGKKLASGTYFNISKDDVAARPWIELWLQVCWLLPVPSSILPCLGSARGKRNEARGCAGGSRVVCRSVDGRRAQRHGRCDTGLSCEVCRLVAVTGSPPPTTDGSHRIFDQGNFSEALLTDKRFIPQNFEVSPEWVRKLEESVERHGASWLHHLFLGTAKLESFNATVARACNERNPRQRALSSVEGPGTSTRSCSCHLQLTICSFPPYRRVSL